jgi:hypothetical protein
MVKRIPITFFKIRPARRSRRQQPDTQTGESSGTDAPQNAETPAQAHDPGALNDESVPSRELPSLPDFMAQPGFLSSSDDDEPNGDTKPNPPAGPAHRDVPVALIVESPDGEFQITAHAQGSEAQIKEAIPKARHLAPDTTTWIELAENHREEGWTETEHLKTLATIHVTVQMDGYDLVVSSPENADAATMNTLIKTALVVPANRTLRYTVSPDHVEGKWRDRELITAERLVDIEVEYQWHDRWTEVSAWASIDEVHAKAREVFGIEPEHETKLYTEPTHETQWQYHETVYLEWIATREQAAEADVTIEWDGQMLHARLPRQKAIDTMLWARAAFRIPASAKMKIK